ncbi:hypothetical protein L1987_23960 [Smallanthus sonchifolius]|uniref:Uncharacterized protein n=1 Tax=Smallanthus sonchifolius TaxID=185202 RepID=A0ACB9IJ39_9ASTR|nr:hypothetical protein L1987_23960 [Smallanthus sonchifolius]
MAFSQMESINFRENNSFPYKWMEKSQRFLISHKIKHRCNTLIKPYKRSLIVSISITDSSSTVAGSFFKTHQLHFKKWFLYGYAICRQVEHRQFAVEGIIL